jgi:putative ABC transport system ATP-binding protein
MELLRTIQLSKSYGAGPAAVQALKPTDLTLEQGRFVAIVGASGSGKSTLLHLLGGLDQPTGGKVLLEGREISGLHEEELAVLRRRKFGYIFQYYNLLPVLSAEENVVLPLLLDGRKVDQEYIDELFDWLGLTQRRHHLPSALSGGQQQRVAIARALACKPSIIFADEPTGNLDREMTREVLDLLRLSIQRYHQTLVMITHDVQIASMADRILTIEDGMIVNDRTVGA